MKNKVLLWYNSHYKKIFFLLLLFALISVAFTSLQTGYDYWWHLKVGEYIYKTGTIPLTSIFSWFGSINNLSWISHEWLSELLLYLYQLIFGSNHIIWFCLINIGLLFTSLYLFNKEACLKNIFQTLVFLAFGIFLIFPALAPRPYLISYILLAILLYLLFDLNKHPHSKKIYLVPIITILYANFHGGSSNLTYILCFMFAFCGLFKFKLKHIESTRLNPLQIKKYCLIGLLSILAILINPHGIKLLLYPFINMQDTLMKGLILEWAPLNITNLSHLPVLIFLIYLVIKLISTKKQISFLHISLMAAFILLTISSVRFAPLLWIVSSFIILGLNSEKIPPIKIWTILSFSFIILGTVSIIKEQENVHNKLNTGVLDYQVISYLKEHKPTRLYNYYDYGGYLIYNNIPVFIDGRADMYSKYNLRDAVKLAFLKGEYQAILDNYNFDYLVIPKTIPLTEYLDNNPQYQLVLTTSKTVIYKLVI
ncbi:MAG: hypothetical protein RR047_02175 [Bacilli bacterium]